MKACLFCAEEIQDAAIVCKHCGRDVPAATPRQTPTVAAPTMVAPKKRGPLILAILGVIFGPLLIYAWITILTGQSRQPSTTTVQKPTTDDARVRAERGAALRKQDPPPQPPDPLAPDPDSVKACVAERAGVFREAVANADTTAEKDRIMAAAGMSPSDSRTPDLLVANAMSRWESACILELRNSRRVMVINDSLRAWANQGGSHWTPGARWTAPFPVSNGCANLLRHLSQKDVMLTTDRNVMAALDKAGC